MPTNFNFAGPIQSYTNDFDFSPPPIPNVTFYSIMYGAGNITSIWADPTASLTNGKFYATSYSNLNVVDLSSTSIYDKYGTTIVGRTGETLNNTDTVDIGVSYGV